MPSQYFTEEYPFPDPRKADDEGLVAYGGDLTPERLLAAYAQGIFPWPYDTRTPLLWFSPDPRMTLTPADLHISRSLKGTLNKNLYEVRFDSAFAEVIQQCATIKRPGQRGTWITQDMVKAYIQLHALGYAHSAEAWRDEKLVGGLYGVSLGAAFFGESMFARQPDASKVAFVHLIRKLQSWDFHLFDCQIYTEHVARFGATPWPRTKFLQALAKALTEPTMKGAWTDK